MVGARFYWRVTGKRYQRCEKLSISISMRLSSVNCVLPVRQFVATSTRSCLNLNWAKTSPLRFITQEGLRSSFKWRYDRQAIDLCSTAVKATVSDMMPASSIVYHQPMAGPTPNVGCTAYSTSRSQNFITSAGLGTMGFGLPAAMGASVGRPDDRVSILISGDGSFCAVNVQERWVR